MGWTIFRRDSVIAAVIQTNQHKGANLTHDDTIDDAFLGFASDILGDTTKGLTGTQMLKAFRELSVRHNCTIKYSTMPSKPLTKRVLFLANLESLDVENQFRIIKQLCDHEKFDTIVHAGHTDELKHRLQKDYGHLNPDPIHGGVLPELVEETKHWLDGYDAIELYNQAVEKYDSGLFCRNMLDDLRLALEKLLCELFSNKKSLENQKINVGTFIKDNGGSKQLQNMFVSLLNYYCLYQNNNVKHDSNVNEQELEFVLELTSSFMKHLVRLSSG